MADGSPEDRSLYDEVLPWFELHDINKPKVMNDVGPLSTKGLGSGLIC